jgi:hypothetical protein
MSAAGQRFGAHSIRPEDGRTARCPSAARLQPPIPRRRTGYAPQRSRSLPM